MRRSEEIRGDVRRSEAIRGHPRTCEDMRGGGGGGDVRGGCRGALWGGEPARADSMTRGEDVRETPPCVCSGLFG